jgi:hypothetical protein
MYQKFMKVCEVFLVERNVSSVIRQFFYSIYWIKTCNDILSMVSLLLPGE